MDLKTNSCVDINVFVKCDKKERYECVNERQHKDDKNNCVNINVYVECEGKEKD